MKIMKKILLLLVFATMMVALAACRDAGGAAGVAGDGGELQPANLRIWAHWGSPQRRPTIEAMVDMFNDAFASYNISAEYVFVPWGEIEMAYITAVVSGTPPDVAITAIEAVAVRAMRNQATDITDFLRPETPGLFYEPIWEAALFEGRVYALPFNTDNRFIYYNRDMFAAAGVNSADIRTWDDMFRAADALDAALAGVDNYRIAFSPLLGNFGFGMMAITNGAQFWDDEMNPSYSIMNNPAMIEALEYTRKWGDRYGHAELMSIIDSGGAGAEDHFIAGRVAMFGHTQNYIATLEMYARDPNGNWLLDYGVFPAPVGPSWQAGQNRTWGGGFVATVPMGVRNPRAATRLAEFMTTGEAAFRWAREQRDIMAARGASDQPGLTDALGWGLSIDLLPYTQTSRRHIFAPDAGTIRDTHVNRFIRDFEAGVTAQMVVNEIDNLIMQNVAEERFIFGVD